MSILVNPSGRVVEVEDEKLAKDFIDFHGFKLANEKQIFEYKIENSIDYDDLDQVFFYSHLGNPDGYGTSSESLRNALVKEGVLLNTTQKGQNVGLVYSYPTGIDLVQTEIRLIYTMFESTKIPEQWIKYLNKAEKVLVPSKFCQEAFLSRGIETEVVPLGYNDNIFYEVERTKKESDPFTFLHYDAFNTRKGWDIVFQAFTNEFANDQRVRLVMKTTKDVLPIAIPRSQYPNIEVIKDRLPHEKLRELISNADCFVFPSRGEGFGLTPLEALACGVAGIIPNGSGMSEYFNKKYFLGLDFVNIPAMYDSKIFSPANTGEMIEPTVASVQKQMRWAFENPEKIHKMGHEGAEWVKKKYTIQHTAQKLAKVLSNYYY